MDTQIETAEVTAHTHDARERCSVDLGIDIGSTTTKTYAIDAQTGVVVFSSYRRHHARQIESLVEILKELQETLPFDKVRVCITGSGGKIIANYLDVPYIQEVVANSIAIQQSYPQARCAIELGGQDAKMIFFAPDSTTGKLSVSDMRMNGSCAGGTGAFIDEVATLLETPVEGFNDLAERGSTLYDISGRCGVYAKTDIQPLLNQGVAREDIALSTFHAIAKQTIGGLAQGLDIHPPVVFEGGPLTFNPRLRQVFEERLNLAKDAALCPDHPETIVAKGAALALESMFAQDPRARIDLGKTIERLGTAREALATQSSHGEPFFSSAAERASWEERHSLPSLPHESSNQPTVQRVYLGIDSGSTTTKFALIDEDENLVDEFYANNEGKPLDIVRSALLDLRDRYRKQNKQLEFIALATTGYGEELFAHALHADYHFVETVAHARAATKYVPDATFILDIGGQDMKAIWLDNGVVTNIVVNEACSSGCGSFLESFAGSLHIPTEHIAEAAFRSTNPALLGSRCTVFMNSSIVTEQRNGKGADDIMAGLCRSIIENVFTKVIRVSNLESLGDRVVVQGGTFRNDAVLRALEQYLGHEVTRAPYPGLMGAIGAALLAKQQVTAEGDAQTRTSSFIGLDAMENFSYEQTSDLRCPFCANHCLRTVVTFSDGTKYVTGNRCPRGEILGEASDPQVRERVRMAASSMDSVPNMFKVRQRLLFADYDCTPVCEKRGITLGLPRVLALWDSAPFWTTLLRALGFDIRLSHLSTRKMYERGLAAVTSDTVCFPAKLVHGHIRDLVDAGVDRIFMPIVTTVPSENQESTSQSMCAVVKGYPLVIRNSDNPERRWGVPFDAPLFHWYTDEDRLRQLTEYLGKHLGVNADQVKAAIAQADAAQKQFREALVEQGSAVIEQVRGKGKFAVVLASRPYHNDPLVNHDLPQMFVEMGIPVLTPDSVPHVNEVDLSRSRIDVVNNYHARMLGSAVIAAKSSALEYVQLVSFGCGHDAYLSDEIIRLMKLTSGKTPLILKVDESDATGPLRIRVRSFIQTVLMRRARLHAEGFATPQVKELPDPYPVKFEASDRKRRVILVPNTSHAFCRLMSAAFAKQGVRTVPLDLGRERAAKLGKRYVHNDICFPAQMTIGESIAALEDGGYRDDEVAIGTGKYIGDCRLTHYAALLRKALDDSGHKDVAIITNDDVDAHNMQPGFKMSVASAIRTAMGLPMIDALEALLRRMRPYELEPGSANKAFDRALDAMMDGLEHHGASGMIRGFRRSIDIMCDVAYDRSKPRPTVLIVGEYLLNFHPGANHDVEDYLERNGLEVIEARMTDVIRKTYFYKNAQVKEYNLDTPKREASWYAIANEAFEIAHNITDHIAAKHPLYEPPVRMPELVQDSDPIIHHTFDAGEGVLIPAEIIHHAKQGCRTFLILQPFGCLPNHIVGRGIAKRLKEMFPDAQILPLDFDPDVSFANLENRLQMLIMNVRRAQATEI